MFSQLIDFFYRPNSHFNNDQAVGMQYVLYCTHGRATLVLIYILSSACQIDTDHIDYQSTNCYHPIHIAEDDTLAYVFCSLPARDHIDYQSSNCCHILSQAEDDKNGHGTLWSGNEGTNALSERSDMVKLGSIRINTRKC